MNEVEADRVGYFGLSGDPFPSAFTVGFHAFSASFSFTLEKELLEKELQAHWHGRSTLLTDTLPKKIDKSWRTVMRWPTSSLGRVITLTPASRVAALDFGCCLLSRLLHKKNWTSSYAHVHCFDLWRGTSGQFCLCPAQLRWNSQGEAPTLVLEPAPPLVVCPQNRGTRGAGAGLLFHGCNAPEVDILLKGVNLWCWLTHGDRHDEVFWLLMT